MEVHIGRRKHTCLGLEDDFDLLFAKKGYTSIQEVIDEQSK